MLCGDTTDGAGFLAALDQELPGWNDRHERAAVVGAGGAARPIVDSLQARGFTEIVLASRTDARAEALAEQLGCAFAIARGPAAPRG